MQEKPIQNLGKIFTLYEYRKTEVACIFWAWDHTGVETTACFLDGFKLSLYW